MRVRFPSPAPPAQNVTVSRNVSNGVVKMLVLVVAVLSLCSQQKGIFVPETMLEATDSDLRLQVLTG
jgi:hypothetical protein